MHSDERPVHHRGPLPAHRGGGTAAHGTGVEVRESDQCGVEGCYDQQGDETDPSRVAARHWRTHGAAGPFPVTPARRYRNLGSRLRYRRAVLVVKRHLCEQRPFAQSISERTEIWPPDDLVGSCGDKPTEMLRASAPRPRGRRAVHPPHSPPGREEQPRCPHDAGGTDGPQGSRRAFCASFLTAASRSL
jgi:hypothetical protein